MALRKKTAIKKQASKPKAPLKKGAPLAKLQALKKSGPTTGEGTKPKPSKNKAAGVLKTKKGEATKAKKASPKPASPKAKKPPAAQAKAKPAKPQAKKPLAPKAKPAKAKLQAKKPLAPKAKPAKAKPAKAKPTKAKSISSAQKAKPSPKKGLKAKPVPIAASIKAKAVLKAKLLKERDAEKALREKEREKAQKEKDREKAQLLKERDAEKNRKEAERVKLQQQKERERVRREKEREQAQLEKSRALEKLQKEKERQASKLTAEREREEQRKAKEAERLQVKVEQAAEKLRLQEEKDLAREQARQAKEDERKAKEDEREAYRKAKEVERDRLRAERQAAKRLLEVKVARAQRRANRGAARGGTRVYRPDAIPNQMGTTRRQDTLAALQSMQSKFANLRSPQQLLAEKAEKTAAGHVFEADIPKPPPAPPVLPPASIEERYALIQARLESQPNSFKHDYAESFDMSWIYHDSALEGVVYTFQELKTAIDPNIAVVPDSSLQPVCEEIRRHKAAIELVRDLAEKKRVPITMDTVKKIYVTLHPEEGDIKNVKYRKDIPQHRLYFHEYAQPEKIALKVRQAIDWLGTPEAKKIKSPVRIAARVHYDLLRIFPFPHDSGKVARLLMNLLLLRAGYPPAIIHSTERQKYYEALKGSLPIIVSMVTDAISNGLASVEKLLDERVTPATAAAPVAVAAAATPASSTPVTPKTDAGDSSEPPGPAPNSDEEATDAEASDDETSFDDDEDDEDENDGDDTSFDSD